MRRSFVDPKVNELQAQVFSAAAAAMSALESFEPSVRSLAIRQLAVDAEIRALASRALPEAAAATPQRKPVATGPYTVAQVAEITKVTQNCVRHWISAGKLKSRKAGSRTLVEESALQDFLTSSTDSTVRPNVFVAA